MELARVKGVKPCDLLRSKIDELLNNDINPEAKARASKILKDLTQPFLYMKTNQGTAGAKKEREIREQMANKIKEGFNIK